MGRHAVGREDATSMNAPESTFHLSPRLAFLLELGRCLQKYGAPAHRLEEALTRVAQRLGMEGQFFCGPTAFFAFIGEQGQRQRTYLERTVAGDCSLDKLNTVYEVAREVGAGRMGAEEGQVRLRQVEDAPDRYSPTLVLLSTGLVSAAAVPLFGGGWGEVLFGGLAGLVGGLVPVFARGRAGLRDMGPALGALAVSFLACLANGLPVAMNPTTLILAGLVVHLPGLTLVTALNELATGHLVAGTARMAGTAMTFLQLAFGVVVGQQLGARLVPVHAHAPQVLPGWTLVPVVILAAMGFLVLFQGRTRDYGWTLGACALGLLGARAGAAVGGPEFGVGLGAFLLGVGSNLFSRRFDRPSLTTLLPGLMLLLPGSWGFRSLGMLFHDQVVLGMGTAVHMVLLATSLLAGLLMANAAVRPRMVL